MAEMAGVRGKNWSRGLKTMPTWLWVLFVSEKGSEGKGPPVIGSAGAGVSGKERFAGEERWAVAGLVGPAGLGRLVLFFLSD